MTPRKWFPFAGPAGVWPRLGMWFRLGQRPPTFVHPISSAPRTVMFEPVFRRTSTCVYIDPAAHEALARTREFAPAVIAGRLNVLLRLAEVAHQPAAQGVGPTHAVVVFTGEGQGCVTEHERDLLWWAFGVPAFEQVITASGHLVAWECEAHDGLHLSPGAQSTAERIVVGVCDCGSLATRAIGVTAAPTLTSGLDVPTLLIPGPIESRPQPLAT